MRLSIVIPALNEAEHIEAAITSAARVADEVVVVDGGSDDHTLRLAIGAGARAISAPRGRGQQLNAGARVASGEVLLFLHADARLPAQARPAVEGALQDSKVQGGNFRLAFVPRGRAACLLSWANDVQRRHLRLYYGDSGIFIRRSAFEALGGFPNTPLMEDHEFVRRLERNYPTRYVSQVEIEASARRFEAAPLRAIGLWTAIHALHRLRVPAPVLARLYRRSPAPVDRRIARDEQPLHAP